MNVSGKPHLSCGSGPQLDHAVLLQVIEQNPASIILTEPDGTIVYVNQRCCAVTGYRAEELLGQNPRLLKGADGYTDYRQLWQTLQAGRQWRGEFHNRNKSGEIFWELALISPIFDEQGNLSHYLAIKEEISSRKKAEEELERTVAEATQLSASMEFKNAEIEQQRQELDQAYAELKATQSQMLQREKMASIGQLAAGVAHEINNPMGFISSNLRSLKTYLGKMVGYLQTVEKEVKTSPRWDELKAERKKLKIDFLLDDCDDLIDESLDGAERVRKIVQNLKTFSRVDQAEEQQVDLNECLESTIAIVWNEIKYKAKLEKDFAELPELHCNPQELAQVFTNLLVNAAQAIDKDGLIRLRSWHDASSIYVSIEDNGCGISEENQARIFEPFFTTKEVGKGTGLGMSISYEIVKKHGGKFELDSTVGKGSCFTVCLPLAGDCAASEDLTDNDGDE